MLCGWFGAGFICSVVLLSADSWPVPPALVFFLEEHRQSGVKRLCLNSGCPCLQTWDKTQRKVRFSRHWSVDRHFEALRGAPKMLQPTTGVVGRSQLFHWSASFLGFLLCIPLLLLQFGFSFPPFFFGWVVYCLGFFESYHWNICILHTAGNSSGTVLGNVGFARGPCRFSDVVLPAPHLRVSGEPYPWELYEWKNEEVMVDRDTSSGHMHVCPAVVALLAGWKSNGLGGALISFFSQVIHLFM